MDYHQYEQHPNVVMVEIITKRMIKSNKLCKVDLYKMTLYMSICGYFAPVSGVLSPYF